MRAKTILAISILAFLLAASTSIAFYQGSAPETETAWVCPMHPDYTMDVTGKCPRCGMELVRAAPFDVRDYPLEFRTTPALVKAGQKIAMRFKIFHPGTGEQIKQFEMVHE
ncbi:MAG TPA: heavy metal-binding domain-containing protein, partial [Bryobacteraceae bacterium]